MDENYTRSTLVPLDGRNTYNFYDSNGKKIATLMFADFQNPGELHFQRRTGREKFLQHFAPGLPTPENWSTKILVEPDLFWGLLDYQVREAA